jgi:hypothetical protein
MELWFNRSLQVKLEGVWISSGISFGNQASRPNQAPTE